MNTPEAEIHDSGNGEQLPAVIGHTTSTALAVPETGEGPYAGIAMLQISPEQQRRLTAAIPPDDLDILPTGEVYASQVRYRDILNETFGPGRWALLPRGGWTRQGDTLCREYALIVNGHFVAEAIGEQDYVENNPRMTWASAAEGCKSNALVRCCKDLGIASECWDRRFTEKFKAEHCVHVWVEGKDKKVKAQWRRRDAAGFYGETGPVAPRQGGGGGDGGAPTPERRSAQAGNGGGGDVISEPQRRRMYAIQKNAGHSDGDVRTWLAAEYGVEHSNEVKRSDYDTICARLEKSEPLLNRPSE